MTDDRCQFTTVTPKNAFAQSARSGAATRYRRCKNKAKHTIVVDASNLHTPDRTREVRCCALHKRLHDEQGWLP